MKFRVLRFLLLFFCVGLSSLTEAKNIPPLGKDKKAAINWITLEQAAALTKKNPRKIFIDVYTDWCGWCRKMEKSTFTNPAIATYVNEHYYAVRFNAESREPVTIEGKTYQYNEQYRSHGLALALLQGQLSYPTTVYLDENLKLITPVPGYLDVPTFRQIMVYFGDNHYKKLSFDQFTAQLAKAGKK